ncbi:DUF2171 domain-containing protein [Ruania halotolerans]|uniref:DUF2171 domain-containing protein n=1 Tax=Ruania halotolerans TaxID=2897773 RepID=UPI001E3ED517|nr:DUF2171 domain-containing protein [Ruania halotolerans]UFU05863.1 DUF2171 domain-containing protein [Ruania halotolerans]
MTNITGNDGPITEVREGMTVFDSTGEKVGTVREIQMGDPQAATAKGQDSGNTGGIVGSIADAFSTGSLPDAAKERLARLGFVRVDASGLFAGDRYAASDEVAAVRDDALHLSVPGDQLIG